MLVSRSQPGRRVSLVVLVSTLLGAAACSGAPASSGARAVGSTSASATSAPPVLATPTRTYKRGERISPVVDEPISYQQAAVSPDGLIVALTSHGERTVHLVDTDRGRVVGRAPGLESGAPQRLRWGGDDVLFLEGYDGVTQVDGRTGHLVARVSNARPGVVRTDRGWAVLIESESDRTLALVDVAHPEKVLARVPAVEAPTTLDLGDGAFAVVSRAGLFAYEACGQERWSWKHPIRWDAKVTALGRRPRVVHIVGASDTTTLSAEDGSPVTSPPAGAIVHDTGFFFTEGGRLREQRWGSSSADDAGPLPAADPPPRLVGVSPGATLFAYQSSKTMLFANRRGAVLGSLDAMGTPVFGSDDLPHVIVGDDAVYALSASKVTRLASKGFGLTPARILAVGETGFAARCEGGATATLGFRVAVPTELTSAEPQGELTSADGSHRVTWDEKLAITRVKDGSTIVLDLAPIASVTAHPDGQTAIVASHVGYVGNAWIADPDAKVSFVDIATGKVKKALRGDECTVTRDGERLIVNSHDDVVLYDAATYRELRRWPGHGNAVALDPTNRFAVVFERAKIGLGPLETTRSFVEDLRTRKKVIDLDRAEGSFAFDPVGSAFAFTPGNGYPNYGDTTTVHVHDLVRGGPRRVIRTDEAIKRVQYLADGVLTLFFRDRVVLHRVRDGQELSLRAIPEGERCRLFATDAAGHFTGDPGERLGLRFGDDLRTSEIVWRGPELEARRDDGLLADFLAAARTSP